VDELPSRESNRRLRSGWSEPPVPYAHDAPLADMMQRYGCGKQAICRQRRKRGISLRLPSNPDSGRRLTLAGPQAPQEVGAGRPAGWRLAGLLPVLS
jgi:hypothetical protein